MLPRRGDCRNARKHRATRARCPRWASSASLRTGMPISAPSSWPSRGIGCSGQRTYRSPANCVPRLRSPVAEAALHRGAWRPERRGVHEERRPHWRRRGHGVSGGANRRGARSPAELRGRRRQAVGSAAPLRGRPAAVAASRRCRSGHGSARRDTRYRIVRLRSPRESLAPRAWHGLPYRRRGSF